MRREVVLARLNVLQDELFRVLYMRSSRALSSKRLHQSICWATYGIMHSLVCISLGCLNGSGDLRSWIIPFTGIDHGGNWM